MADVIITTLRLQGQAQYIAGLRQASGAVGGLDAATESARVRGQAFGNTLDRVGRGIIRWSGRAITAFGAVAGASVLMGIKFNASMEQSLIAFESFTGSGKQARKTVNDLVELAAKTPFEIQGLLQASQMMMSAGLAAEDLLPTMKNVGDAVAAAGRSSESIDRMGYALQQVLTTGHLTGNELRQMSEAGVPAMKLMAEGANKTGEQFKEELEAGTITAGKAIEWLNKGIEQNEKIAGLAGKQAKSLAGQWSTAKDNFRILTGVLSKDTSSWLSRDALPGINRFLTGTTDALRSTTFDAQQKFNRIKQLARQQLFPLGQDIGRAFERARLGDKLVVALEHAIPRIAEMMGRAGGRALVAFIKGWWAADPLGKFTVLFAIFFKMGIFGKAGTWAGKKFITKFAAWLAGTTVATKLGTLATSMGGSFGKKFGKESGKKAGRYFAIGLVAAIGAEEAYKGLKRGGESFLEDFLSFPLKLKQTGGRIAGGGWQVVGEVGPEMVRLPTGSNVYPHHSISPAALSADRPIKLHNTLYLDGKVVTRSVAHHTANDVARSPHGSGYHQVPRRHG